MPYDSKKHRRRSLRLPDYDYRSPGAYFVTICTHQGELLFGDVVDGEVALNEYGQEVCHCWMCIPKHFSNVELDAWVVMPNHLHGILVITDLAGAQHAAPLPSAPLLSAPLRSASLPSAPLPSHRTNVQPGSLGAIVRSFKSAVTTRINRMLVWQRNYYERIIRNDTAMGRIREYVQQNPARWAEDRLHPAAPRNPKPAQSKNKEKN